MQVAYTVVVHQKDVLLGERLFTDITFVRPVGVQVFFQGVVHPALVRFPAEGLVKQRLGFGATAAVMR